MNVTASDDRTTSAAYVWEDSILDLPQVHRNFEEAVHIDRGNGDKKWLSLLEKGNHPEFDTSELLDTEELHRDHLLMGFLQSAVSLGRMDVATVVVVAMSSFRAIPRQGHLESAEHIVGFLPKN